MKRSSLFAGTLSAAAAAAVGMTFSAVPAHAQEAPCFGSGAAYGQHHAELAQAGALGGERNPGDHQGYSSCQE